MEDIKIVALFFERDEAALRETSQKYSQALRNISYNIVCDRETAEECENDTPILKRGILFLQAIRRDICLPFLRELSGIFQSTYAEPVEGKKGKPSLQN